MAKYRKKPVIIEATQWFKNGDHPEDHVGEVLSDLTGGPDYGRQEGAVVRYFRRPEPEYASKTVHDQCGRIWHDHGWIDTLEGGHAVCPGRLDHHWGPRRALPLQARHLRSDIRTGQAVRCRVALSVSLV